MVTRYARERLLQAAEVLPPQLRLAVSQLPEQVQSQGEEIRLRAGRPMTIVTGEGELSTPKLVTGKDLEMTLENASQASAYAVLDQVRKGFVTIRGGHRLGLCGTGVVKNGEVTSLRQVSSLALRVAREVPGTAAGVLEELLEEGRLQSTLILSPPGRGKTTLLRDLIRCVSDGRGLAAQRVGVADERGELAAVYGGSPQLDVGIHTDVVDHCPKAAAMLMLLRGMNPQVIAADEITAPEDVEAMEMANGCGVILLSTAHAGGLTDLCRRPLYRRLVEQRIFQRIVSIEVRQGRRVYHVSRTEEAICCGC